MTKEMMSKLTLAIEEFNRAQEDEENHIDLFEALCEMNTLDDDAAEKAIAELKQHTAK